MRITRADIAAMFERVDDETREIAVRHLRKEFSDAIAAVNAGPEGVIAPPAPLIMTPFELCPARTMVGVLIGQDPFPTAGRAHGLAFSTLDGSIQPSTRNIYACLRQCGLMTDEPTHGNLTKWARQGVLMINCSLTTLIGKPNAHETEWSTYSRGLIKRLGAFERPLFFILLGTFAHAKERYIQPHHRVIKWGHPSPVSSVNQRPGPKNFINADVFQRANDFLIEQGSAPIDWDVNVPLPEGYVAPVVAARVVEPPAAPCEDVFADAALVPVVPIMPQPMPRARWNALRDHDAALDPALPPNSVGTVYLFTDGASIANGKPACRASWGFYVTDGLMCADVHGEVAPTDLYDSHGRLELFRASNNRGELEAIFRGLEFVRAHLDELTPDKLIVVSDSEYAIGCVNAWVDAWKADPSKLAGKKNIDLIFAAKAELDEIERVCTVQFAHMRSHCREPPAGTLAWFAWRGNDIADQLCAQAIGSTDTSALKRTVAREPRMIARGSAC